MSGALIGASLTLLNVVSSDMSDTQLAMVLAFLGYGDAAADERVLN